MKKRVVSLLLALVMLTSLVPTTVWAEDAYSVAPDTEMQDIRQERDNEDEQEDDPALAGQPMLSAVMPAAVTLTGSGTKDDPYLIGSAEELASLSGRSFSGKSYRLTQDIDMENVSMQPIEEFADGTFDGDGHTISNLTISAASGNAGLFAETNSSTVFKNIILHNVSVTLTGGSYAGVGGLIGKIYGSTTIQGCGVSGAVTYSGSSIGYVGGLVGYLNGKCTIKESYSQATIKNENNNSSSTAGGLLGKTGNYYTLSVTDCYASGDVTAAGGRAGGFTGYVYCSNRNKHTYENCYAAGTVQVTGASSNACGFAYSYAYSGYTFTNCYYNNSANTSGCNRSDAGIAGKTTDELKDLALTLGDAFQPDTVNLNNGYPILSWQYIDPDAKHTVSFELSPIGSVLTWNKEVQAVSADGKYTFADVGMGQYDYSVTNEAGDYAAKSGTVTVKGKDVTERVELVQNRHKLSFNVQPENAELIVKSGTTELTAESENTYSVVNGTYTYTAELFGYKTAQGSVAVDRADKTHTVTMQAEPAVTVTFANADKGQLTVVNGERTMSPDKNGAYALPVGYRYDWTFKSANYAKQTGSIDLTGVTEDGTRTVTIPLAEKTAWGGADDIVAPTKVGDVYQIGSGGELAWFAQEVNAGRGAAYNAVLTKDIDLGDEPWTPIGKSTSYAYKGTFDGQGYTIKGLYINSSVSNQALFGYVSGGTVKNLTVEGTVIGGECTAGIIGEQNGTACVENCVNRATVSGTNNVGGIVGKVNGSSEKYIRACANLGNISGSNSVGGIVGYAYYKVTVSHCYNRGSVTAEVSKAGGIVGYMNDSGAKFSNCYTTGAVKGKDSAAVVGKKSSGGLSGCYYLDTLGTDSNATAKTADELKALASTLGEPFMTAPAGVNDGYPVLRWQIPTYAVTFTVTPADAVVTIDGQTGTHTGGQWVFKLPDGTYAYTVSAFGYQAAAGQVTVNGKAQSVTVTLTPVEKRTVRFNITPAEAKAAVTVTWDGDGRTVAAQSDGSYLLPEGAYTYTVKAKGYAKAGGTLNVTKDETISVTLTPSAAWDGETRDEKPSGEGTEVAPYQIGSGAELAWLADKVNNASSVTKLYVELTDDIDLGGQPWTPIGKFGFSSDDRSFSGSFRGNGHTVNGLNVSAEYAGLFGSINDAEITGVVVQGTVVSTNTNNGDAGGIVGRAIGTKNTITDCGSEATVSGGSYCGGILGNSQNGSCALEITGCYNSGRVSAKDRAAGIVARFTGSSSAITLNTCYNTGEITSESYASGIYGSNSVTISDSYTVGAISGKDASSSSAFSTGSYDTLTNCYYLTGSVPTGAKVGAATAMSDAAMRTELLDKLGTDNWKTVRGVNSGYPVLSWQTDETPAAVVTMAKNIRFAREEFDTDDGDVTSLPTGLLLWDAESGKTYTITLWQMVRSWTPLDADGLAEYDAITGEYTGFPSLEKLEYVNTTAVISRMSEEQRAQLDQLDAAVQAAESDQKDVTGEGLYQAMERRAAFIVSLAKTEDLGAYESQLTFVEDIAHVSGGEYDLSGRFAARGDGVYYASVAEETDGQTVCCDIKTVERRIVGDQEPYNRMTAVTGLRWEGTTAKWNGRENFSGAYRIDLYTVTGEGTDAVYTHFKTFALSGNYTSANFANAFAAGKKYAFTVTAIGDQSLLEELGLTDSITSAYSDVYDPDKGEENPSTKEWVDISSAAQWIELANVKDELTGGTDSPNRQQVAWGKNYRLTADIDFSGLTAAEQTKTKSIGRITYPFMGEFDGQGHTITGLTLSNNDSGLFWYTGATAYIHDLTIEGANVLFSDNAAVLVHNNYGRMEKCAVVNTNITADTGAVLGGMVSRNYGIIRSSYVQGGTLTSNSLTATGHAGFVGANETGGLIEGCWTSMAVNTTSEYAGGFVGLGYGGTIRNCFALGNVSARGYSGGFVGRSVYGGNTYENCYAAGVVTVSGEQGNGFIGGNKPDSAFQYDQSKGVTNCYFNSAAASAAAYGAVGKSLDEMKTDTFLTAISGSDSGVWAREADKNGGLPYLRGVAVPETAVTAQITVKLAIASYDKNSYTFNRMGDVITVTMDSNGNTRLVDLMDEAQRQGLLTYSYATTSTFGRFIHTINGRAVDAPDGWMFTVNDTLSNVSASLATVQNGDQVLWFEGTTENRFQGPSWKELTGTPAAISWVDIETVDDLLALAKAADAETLGKNYRLKADLNLKDTPFNGIGSADQPFTGMFDGQGHTISHVTVNAPEGENAGFFNVIKGATIRNLKLVDVEITGKANVGGLAGSAQVQLDSDDLSKNVANLIGGCSVSGTVTGTKNVGGLVGLNEGKTDPQTLFSIASAVDKCAASVTVNGKEKTGGLVGKNGGTITKSSSGGTVKGDTTTGGLVGDSSGDIYDSHTSCTVAGSSHTGGFVGFSDGAVQNCYSIGGVSGTDYTGGFAGVISRAENVVSAGQVTIAGTPTQGYNGGFAGKLYGMVAGLDNQITVKNASGNCTQPNGPDLPVVGNAIDFSGDAQKEALEKMALRSNAEVNAALKKLFPDPVKVMDTVAAANTERAADWWAMDMGAYARAYPDKGVALTEAAKQNYINAAITAIQSAGATDTTYDKAILALTANGVDATKLYPTANSSTALNAITLLNKADKSTSAWSAPYTLAAYNQADFTGTQNYEQQLVEALLRAQKADGSWDEWGTIDTTANVLAGLAFYAGDSRVKTAIDKAVDYLATQLGESGIYSDAFSGPNANSTAMVIIGLTAVGVDPEKDARFSRNGLSVVEGLMSFALANNTGFGFTDNISYNDAATEQSFRALIALTQFRAAGKAFNVYDFSAGKTEPAYASGAGETEKPPEEPTQGEDITVTVTISTPDGTWLSKSVTVKKGSTVYHAFAKALEGSGITAVGAESGYIRSMTKGGVTYGEFTAGPNSGWLYKVNGRLPSLPLTQQAVADKDYVLWYYTSDWKTDPDAGKMGDEEVTAADVIKLIDAIGTVSKNSGNAIAAARTAYNKLPADQKKLVTNYDKLTAAEAAYAEILKALREDETQTGDVTGWRKTHSDTLDTIKTDELTFGSEWLVIALARSGRDVPDSYYDSVVKAVQSAKGQLSDKKSTEYARTILALTAIGKDPADVGGYDLLARLADMDDVTYQGINGAIFALLALDSGKYDVPAAAEGGTQVTRDGLVAYILAQQLSDGGWALSGTSADPDVTAMALQALAPYRTGDETVDAAVDKGVQLLSDMQLSDGGYSSWGTLNSESCAQVLIALATLGIDPASDSRFVKNGLTVLDALLAYAVSGGFRHTVDGEADAIATEQALCALTAYARLLDGKTALYDMTDVLGGQTADDADNGTNEQPAKTTPVVVWIVLGAAAVAGSGALALTRRRKVK